MRITCPACGVNMELPGDDAWGLLNCVQCGKRIRFGEPPLEQSEDDIGIDFGSGGDAPISYARTKPVRRNREWRKTFIAGAVGAMATAMLVVLGLVIQRAMSPAEPVSAAPLTVAPAVMPWDQVHRGELLRLKAWADGLATQGKWQESYDAYQQILMYVGDHAVTDPVAMAIVGAVRPGQDRAMSAMVVIAAPSATTQPLPATTGKPALTLVLATTFPTTARADDLHLTRSSPVTQPTTAPVAVMSQNPADLAPPLAGPPPPPPSLHAYTLPDAVTDEQIGEAINKGVRFLASQFRNGEVSSDVPVFVDLMPTTVVPKKPRPDKKPTTPAVPPPPSDLDRASDLPTTASPPPMPNNLPVGRGGGFRAPNTTVFSTPGIDALCVYALLNGGRAQDVRGLGEKDPFTQAILDQLKQYDMSYTYHRSLRAAALAVFHRTGDNAALEEDVRWLEAASMKGAYTYEMPGSTDEGWDNSNSQYGLLGVWSGAQAGLAVANSYWTDVEYHWSNCCANGTWGYNQGGAGSLTMTCAGVASLLVARDYLDAADHVSGTLSASGDRPSSSLAVDAGLAWLDNGDNCMSQLWGGGMGGSGYGLYGLERVGLASGFKYFGRHDWYAELAKHLVAEQHLNGSWGGGEKGVESGQAQLLIDTSYALLFLARGRHPILFNKLRYNGNWNNRPHDVAHLARFASQQLERPLNWQVVNLRRNWFDWMDCPVLYISGDKPLTLSDRDYTALHDFAMGGGLIFTHADGGSPAFNKWVEVLVRKLFPKYELMQIPREHSIYSTVYHLKNPVPLLAVSNASRLLLVHSPTDVAGGWQLDWTDEKKPDFQLGINLFVYAAGKGNFKNRLASSYIPDDPDRPQGNLQVARLQYPGEWDPEPYAWTRFSRYFQWETHQAIVPAIVQMKLLKAGAPPLAVLTGTVAHDFTEAESAAARAYVTAGGVLLIDACGGMPDFKKSVLTTLLPRAFPDGTLVPIAGNHPLLIPSRTHADNLVQPLLRSFAVEMGGKDTPIETMQCGKGWVVLSRLDLTTGLLGTQSWGINGYSPAYSQALMKNAVLWAAARSVIVPGH